MIDQVNISSFSFFTSISRMYSILPYLLVLDNEGKKLRPIWKSYNNLCKIHFTHIKSISLSIQVIILLLKIYFKKMDVHSTFFIIGSYWIMQNGGLDQFGCDITTYIKSTSLISTLNLCLFFLSNSCSDILWLQEIISYVDSSISNNWTLQKTRWCII